MARTTPPADAGSTAGNPAADLAAGTIDGTEFHARIADIARAAVDAVTDRGDDADSGAGLTDVTTSDVG